MNWSRNSLGALDQACNERPASERSADPCASVPSVVIRFWAC